VSRSFVRLALDGRPPLGSVFKVGQEGEGFRYARIVGVVPDTYAASDVAALGSSRRNPAQAFVTPASFASAAERAATWAFDLLASMFTAVGLLALFLAAGGLALGLVVGYALARPVASVTFGVDADDP